MKNSFKFLQYFTLYLYSRFVYIYICLQVTDSGMRLEDLSPALLWLNCSRSDV